MSLDPSKKKVQLRKTPAEKPAEKPATASNLSSHVTNGANHVINSPNIPTNKEVIPSSEVMSLLWREWFNYTCCVRDRHRDQDLDQEEWVVWFYVEPFTPHLNRDRDRHLLSPLFWFQFRSLPRYQTQPVWLHQYSDMFHLRPPCLKATKPVKPFNISSERRQKSVPMPTF